MTRHWILSTAILVFGAGCSNELVVPSIAAPQPVAQGYVGSDSCKDCHGPFLHPDFNSTYYDDWAASAHGRTVHVTPNEQNIVADRDGNGSSDFRDGLDLATLPQWTAYAPGNFAPLLGFDAASGAYVLELGTRTYAIEKVLGIGREQQTYLTRLEGSLYVLPVVYDVSERAWRPFQPEHWYLWDDTDSNGRVDGGETLTGLIYATAADSPVSRGRTADSWDRSCAGCHVTGLTAVRRNAEGEFLAEHTEDGVACEACHGPGRLHAESLGGRDLPNRAIVNPARLSSTAHRDLCTSCHANGTSVGTSGGVLLDFAWRADDSAFVPGQSLSDALTLAASPDDSIHSPQQGSRHQGQDCVVCHSAHNTTNRALIRMTIDTPSSRPRDVLFTDRIGAPGSGGLLGDATDGVFTDVCEVCHTRTRYSRNDGSAPNRNHNNGEACTDCHDHSEGFRALAPAGGTSCDVCHTALAPAMTAGTAVSRHLLDDTSASAPTDLSTMNCRSCHVDHDQFGSDNRGANLRADIADPTTAVNTDFLDSGSGGICLSCHTDALARSSGGAATTPIPYDATQTAQIAAYAAGAHSYAIASTFGGGGTNTFMADCSKCHNDDMEPKSSVEAQSGVDRFGLHSSTHSGSLAPLGSGATGDPAEEDFCFRCHSSASDPVGGTTKAQAGRAWYGTVPMSARSEDIWASFTSAYGHPVGATRGEHVPGEGRSSNWNPAGNRHVECSDCHSLHAPGRARQFDTSGLFAQPLATGNLAASTPLSGVWGVDVNWPAEWTRPTGFTRVESSTRTWQVCMKCHSGYAYGNSPPAGQTDLALEFNPNNASYHAVVGASRTTFPPNNSFVGPWTKTSAMNCSDCHTSDSRSAAQGPHGSAVRGILAGPFNSTTGQTGTEDHLCFKCHDFDVYGRDGKSDGSATGFSRGEKNLHTKHMKERHFSRTRNATCFDCHAAVPHGWHRRALLVVDSDPAPYNNGSAGLSGSDIPNWPASGNWEEKSCDNAKCH